jgi:amidase
MSDLLINGSLRDLGHAIRTAEVSIPEMVNWYLTRIEQNNHQGPALNCLRSVAPQALEHAQRLSRELAEGHDRGPLHGIPILVKDNMTIARRPSGAAGVKALENRVPLSTATLITLLESAGAIVLGSTNLTELADYVSDVMPSEFSGISGVVRNPHGIRYGRGQGSSVGSAAAVAAGMAPVAMGSETQNSIQAPASYSSVVGFKPTVGAVSRAGILPLVPSQDSPGPLTRTVDDAALVFYAIRGADMRDTATLEAHLSMCAGKVPDSLSRLRIGVPRRAMAERKEYADFHGHFEKMLRELGKAGATIIDPCDLPSAEEMLQQRSSVFRTEFKAAFNTFLAQEGSDGEVRSLADLIQWNTAHSEYIPYGQPLLLAAQQTDGLNSTAYITDRLRDIELSRRMGIEAAMSSAGVEVLIAPVDCAAKFTGKSGAPALTIPTGVLPNGNPVGITLFTRPGEDWKLLAIGALVEHAIGKRSIPSLTTQRTQHPTQ